METIEKEYVNEYKNPTYTLKNNDTIECTVKRENQNDTIIKFFEHEKKLAYTNISNKKINDEIELKKIYKKYDLNDSIINSYFSKLIKQKNTTENNSTPGLKNQMHPIPVKSKSSSTRKTETKEADNF